MAALHTQNVLCVKLLTAKLSQLPAFMVSLLALLLCLSLTQLAGGLYLQPCTGTDVSPSPVFVDQDCSWPQPIQQPQAELQIKAPRSLGRFAAIVMGSSNSSFSVSNGERL